MKDLLTSLTADQRCDLGAEMVILFHTALHLGSPHATWKDLTNNFPISH